MWEKSRHGKKAHREAYREENKSKIKARKKAYSQKKSAHGALPHRALGCSSFVGNAFNKLFGEKSTLSAAGTK